MALQALYRMEITGDESGEGTERLWKHFEGASEEARRFAAELVRGVIDERERIDELLAEATENWSLGRLSRVDLNILRIGAHEMLRVGSLPTSVVINEAIEIARRYGTVETGQFVNGILDRIAGMLGVRDRDLRPKDG
jgi:N utilization substance protein B